MAASPSADAVTDQYERLLKAVWGDTQPDRSSSSLADQVPVAVAERAARCE
jgi:hypothetical protein